MTLCGARHPKHESLRCDRERDHDGDHGATAQPTVHAWPLSYAEGYRGFGSNTRPYRGKDWRNRMH